MDGYNKDSSKKEAINCFNLGAWALARFSTVAELKKALDDTQVRMRVCVWGGGVWVGGCCTAGGPAQALLQ
jgi:hypothetical protein